MVLFDKYLHKYDFSERHHLEINASSDQIMQAVAAYDPKDDAFFRKMIALRELPLRFVGWVTRKQASQTPFGLHNFQLLERTTKERVYGLIGRFWQADYGLVTIADGEAFLRFNEPGVAKLALGYIAVESINGKTVLTTETRVHCPDRGSYLRFAPYWYAIRPVSGWIRRRMLHSIKRLSETVV
ncbi:hypothetical protein [Glaciimonas soli]|uniref:DUF2867 domain-containing protein n=1 Tax=Glaciimonas soli TaxID=2590999 RepID=A0A843YKY1_9BURK|nr:hypothetical protein [Glaciimonas soli]MQR00509.1 hypothetical protein [Glaciimonas soli]